MSFHVLCMLNYVMHYFVYLECVMFAYSFDFALQNCIRVVLDILADM